MPTEKKLLAQARENSTNAVSVYNQIITQEAYIDQIILCNTSGAPCTVRLFFDEDGTTYDETTALFFDSNVDANQTVELNTFISMNDSTGNLGIRTDTASALTFTAFGAVIT